MTIREVEQRLNVTRANVRFYEKEGLIFPKRNPLNDYRDYSEEDVESLNKIIFFKRYRNPDCGHPWPDPWKNGNPRDSAQKAGGA